MARLAPVSLGGRIRRDGQQQSVLTDIPLFEPTEIYLCPISRNRWSLAHRNKAHDGLLFREHGYVSSGTIEFVRATELVSCRDYIPLVNLIGVFFQIRDDLMNLQSTEVRHDQLVPEDHSAHLHRSSQYTQNKGFAEDLSEGKFSFPIIHGIHANTSNRQILSAILPHVFPAQYLPKLMMFSFS